MKGSNEMLVKIRKGVFETNSSSMHSICVTKNGSVSGLRFPEKVLFKHGEFGWEEGKLTSVEEKASYLYQAICELYQGREKEKMLNQIYSVLGKYHIEAEFEEEEKDEYGFELGYIDHPGGDLGAFCECTVWNEKDLMKYLFSPESFVITGNDNTDVDYGIQFHVPYKHKEYFKGN